METARELESVQRAMTPRRSAVILVGLSLATVVVLFLQPPIPQDPTYHHFADGRTLLGVPNFVNLVSNVPFALAGVLGLSFLLGRRAAGADGPFVDPRERGPYLVFFAGMALTSVGSAYYHWAPDNARLVWDRLPMTLAFMSLFAAVIAERIRITLGLGLLWPLLGAGFLSVLYWHVTESRGAGDLRPYALVQFYPMLAIPLMMTLYPSRYTRGVDLLVALAFYGASKVLEVLDVAIFRLGHVVSGHALKHVVAAVSAYWILRMLKRRRSV